MIATYNCNLKCPHCTLRNKQDRFNREQLIESVKLFANARDRIIFGGEPSTNLDRVEMIAEILNPTSISTNLIDCPDRLIDLIKRYDCHVATSWNKARFSTDKQYNRWVSNLKKLKDNHISVDILITLTDDLIDTDPTNIISLIGTWNHAGIINRVVFEQLVDDRCDQQFYDRVDRWLVSISKIWPSNYPVNEIENMVNHWRYDCFNKWTIDPSGQITNLCPQATTQYRMIDSCMTCQYNSICRPCVLHKHCTFPKQLYQYVQQSKQLRSSCV